MFGAISSSFSKIFGGLSSKNVITEKDILNAIEEIKIALLGADVSLNVANKVVSDLKEELIGKTLPKNLHPSDAIAGIVQKRLTDLLGSEFKGFSPASSFEVMLLIGPYGSGKTTTSVKLAKHLQKKFSIKVCVASCDVNRPAAAKQLEDFAHTNGVTCLEYKSGSSVKQLIENAVINAQKNGFGLLILDTFGVENEEGYTQIEEIYKTAKPSHALLVLDSMTGQNSTEIAKKFASKIKLTGIILTKTEGDSRGGAAINARHETNLQIQYIGTGENGDAIEEFHPDRIASRLLDRGDLESVIEKAYETMGEQNLNSMKDRMLSGNITFDDLLTQFQSMEKMGGLTKMMSFLPGASQFGSMMNANTADFTKQKVIILSMTPKERKNPKLLDQSSSRRVRIAKGSGTTLADVKKLLNQLEKMKEATKMMQKMQHNGLSLDDLKNFDMSKLKNMLR